MEFFLRFADKVRELTCHGQTARQVDGTNWALGCGLGGLAIRRSHCRQYSDGSRRRTSEKCATTWQCFTLIDRFRISTLGSLHFASVLHWSPPAESQVNGYSSLGRPNQKRTFGLDHRRWL